MSKKRVKNGRELKRELERLGDISDDKFEKVIKKLAFDGFGELVIRTPVDTGFARSSWRVGVNSTDELVIYAPVGGVYAPPQYGNPEINIGDIVSIYNNVVYMERLENGWSMQAPTGMVEPTYSRLTQIAKQLADTLSKERLE